MGVNSDQLEEIMRGYSLRRSERDRLILERKKKLLEETEGYRDLENEALDLFHGIAIAGVSGEPCDIEAMRRRITEIREEQRKLLLEKGYDSDYLDPPYGCPKCRDTGFLEDGSRCSCFLEKKRDLLYDQSNIKKLISSQNFDTISFEYYKGRDLERFRMAVNKCREFCDSFSVKPMDLFLYGTPGNGKSFLSCCIADRILKEDIGAVYYSSQQFFDTLYRQVFKSENDAGEGESLLDVPLLIIDDLGAELTNSWSESGLFMCLNSRQREGLHTVISTNLSLDDLRERYGDRIFSRIMGNFELLCITGPDIRLEGKKKKLSGANNK